MKLTTTTVQILRKFADINPNIFIEPGNIIRTMKEDKTIFAQYESDEQFDGNLAIFDLPRFLNAVKLLENPEITFPTDPMDSNITIRGESGGMLRYRMSPRTLLKVPSKGMGSFAARLEFVLTGETKDAILSAANALKVDSLSLRNRGTELVAKIFAPEDMNGGSRSGVSDFYEFLIGEVDASDESDEYEYIFKISNLPSFAGDYNVSIAQKIISRFTHTNMNLNYWIAVETKNS